MNAIELLFFNAVVLGGVAFFVYLAMPDKKKPKHLKHKH